MRTFMRRLVKIRNQVSDADLRPFAQDFLDVLSEVVSGVAPVVGPFLVGVRQLLDKLDEVESRKSKARTLGRQMCEVLNTTEIIGRLLEGTHMEESVAIFFKEVKEQLATVLDILLRSQGNIFLHLRTTQKELDECSGRINDLRDSLILKFLSVHTNMQAQTFQAITKVTDKLDTYELQVMNQMLATFQPLLALASKTPNISHEVTMFAEKKLSTIQANTHVDPQHKLAFQECINKIVAPENVKIFTKSSLKIDQSLFPRRVTDSIVRKALVDDPVLGHLTVAVKTPCSGDVKMLDALKRRFTREIHVLQDLYHPNVVPFYGVYEGTDREGFKEFGIVSKYQQNSDLFSYVFANRTVNRLKLLYDASMGMKYLHSRGVYHGNIKCSNIFVDENGTAAIGDFSRAHVVNAPGKDEWNVNLCLSETPSEDWLAPERSTDRSRSKPTAASDVYSFAMSILECLILRKPFGDKAKYHSDVLARVLNRDNRFPDLRDRRPDRPTNNEWMSDTLWDFLMRCWAEEPEERPTARDVVITLLDEVEAHAVKDKQLNVITRV